LPTIDPQKQREFATQVVARLHKEGYIAYWAGGCVRDMILGLPPKDYDVATNATPREVRRLFGRRRTLLVGAVFGVVTVLGPREAGQIEVATFRRDAAYTDGRHPDAVTFSSPEEDAARRDFTINGMFYDPLAHRVIDLVEGRRDLDRRLLRAIGDPKARFAEDKLRMLRSVRFAASYDLALEPGTFKAMADMADQVNIVSAERIAQEMRLILVHASRARAMELLRETGLLGTLLPEVVPMIGLPQHKPRQPGGDLWQHTLLVLELLKPPSFSLALAALLHDVGKPNSPPDSEDRPALGGHELVGANMAAEICRRWRLSKKERQHAVWLVRHHMIPSRARQMRWPALQRILISPGIVDLLDLAAANAEATDGDMSSVEYCRQLCRLPKETLNPAPLVSGHDLMRHGVPQGKIIKRLLDQVRDAQLDKQVCTQHEALSLVDRLLAEGLIDTEPSDEKS